VPAYMPILKSKLAEFWSWTHSSQAVLANARVLYEIVPTNDVNATITNFVSRLSRGWPTGAVVTVDSSRLSPPNGVVLPLAQALHHRNVAARPVVRLSDSPHVLAEVRAAAALHGKGACLRLGSEEQDPDPTVSAQQLAALLGETALAPTDIDLLIDFWTIASPRDVTRCVPLALTMLTWAAALGPWRSVTLASGAFPQSITRLPLGAVTSLPRYDAQFFGQVAGANPALQPDYGDYGINHPSIQPPVPRGPKPNLRYADGLVWQVHREDTLRPGNESFYTVCENVVRAGYWVGPAYCAGDAEIERCSRNIGGPGTATQWLAFGGSHHIAHVIDRLATLGVP
jgi:hypothetical protein